MVLLLLLRGPRAQNQIGLESCLSMGREGETTWVVWVGAGAADGLRVAEGTGSTLPLTRL